MTHHIDAIRLGTEPEAGELLSGTAELEDFTISLTVEADPLFTRLTHVNGKPISRACAAELEAILEPTLGDEAQEELVRVDDLESEDDQIDRWEP